MGNSLRCCLACVLPCGALDLIRIVHLNGSVEEMTGPITAGEVLKANPHHILSKPSANQGDLVRRILVLSPDTELKRGSIYFLIPANTSSPPAAPEKKSNNKKKKVPGSSASGVRHNRRPTSSDVCSSSSKVDDFDLLVDRQNLGLCDVEITVLPEKIKSMSSTSSPSRRQIRERRRSGGRVGDWRPHLGSISELD